MYVHIHDIHMYTHILTKYREINSFMMGSFVFNIKKEFS